MSDHTGKKYGECTVIRQIGKDRWSNRVYVVRCKCGSERKCIACNLPALTRCLRCRWEDGQKNGD